MSAVPAPAEPRADDFRAALAGVGAEVPERWLERVLEQRARWLLPAGSVHPLTGRPISPHAWALLVFQGLIATCGGRAATVRGRALAYDLASAVTPIPVRGTVAARAVSAPVQKSIWVRELLAGARARDGAAACLLALESSGALVQTPAAVEQARWRLGPGAEVTDAQAIGSLVADVLWHCNEDPVALLRELARRAAADGGRRAPAVG
jgi:hypothetical protein